MRMILLQVGGFRVLADVTMLVLATVFGLVMGAWWAKRLEGIEPRVSFRIMLPLRSPPSPGSCSQRRQCSRTTACTPDAWVMS